MIKLSRKGARWLLAALQLPVLGWVLFVAPPAGAGTAVPGATGAIKEIRFVGNRKTRPRTMLQEMLIKAGDAVDMERIERSRQAIMDLGLFQSVKAELLPGEDGRVLLVTVAEKRYWFIIPRLDRSAEGDISYGGQIRFDNLAGLNQRLEVNYKVKDLANYEVDEERTVSVSYSHPRIRGGPYQVDVALEAETSDMDAERNGRRGRYEKDTSRVEFMVSRWLGLRGPSRGWRWKAGVLWYDLGYEHVSGAAGLFTGGTTVALKVGIDYSKVRDLLYSRSGKEYGYQLELADDALGSDIDYVLHTLFYRAYLPVFNRPHTNLNLQLRMGTSNESFFGEEFFKLGGASTLRGYPRKSIKGNTFVLANVELLTPLFGHYATRGVVFADVGNAYADSGELDLTDLKSSVGVGFRWKIKSFVELEIRADAAYAVNAQKGKLYVGTKGIF